MPLLSHTGTFVLLYEGLPSGGRGKEPIKFARGLYSWTWIYSTLWFALCCILLRRVPWTAFSTLALVPRLPPLLFAFFSAPNVMLKVLRTKLVARSYDPGPGSRRCTYTKHMGFEH
jgi:hypothetical protein